MFSCSMHPPAAHGRGEAGPGEEATLASTEGSTLVDACLSLREHYFVQESAKPDDSEWVAHLQACAQCRMAYQCLPQVDRALAAVGESPVSVPAFAAISRVAASAARRQRRRRAIRRSAPFIFTGLTTAALAAGLMAAVWIGQACRPSPKLLRPGTELQATTKAKSAVLGNGVRLHLDFGSVRLATSSSESETLLLPLGRIVLDVPKLPPGNALTVRTPDAEVRVHGTRFHVMRTKQDTHVHVVDGVVEVRPEGVGRPPRTLRAGESATISSAGTYRESLRESTLASLDHGEFVAAERLIGQLLGSSVEPIQQAEAHALLAWTLSARGRHDEALRCYQRALALLPEGEHSLWAENACAELALLAEQQSPRRSARAWTECLRRFPDGVHATLASSRALAGR